MKIYVLSFEVPLPEGVFAEAEAVARLKGPVEACLKAWVGAKVTGLKMENRVVDKRGDYGQRKPRIVPPEPVDTAPVEIGGPYDRH